jgi:hypothetical protein
LNFEGGPNNSRNFSERYGVDRSAIWSKQLRLVAVLLRDRYIAQRLCSSRYGFQVDVGEGIRVPDIRRWRIPGLSGFKLHTRLLHQELFGLCMLRIETEMDGRRMVLRLIGRVRFDSLGELRQRVQNQRPLIVLDLTEVNLVDLQSVRFLRDCQDQKVELRNCAPYILEWIRRERDEEISGTAPKTQL